VSTPAPGPLGEEALRLVEAAREWAVRTFPAVDAQSATGAPECSWCPLCRAVAVLRGDRPEVTERLAEVVTAVAGALAAVLDAAGRPASASEPAPAAPAHRVEPIPVDED
jgi:hypothetical protein